MAVSRTLYQQPASEVSYSACAANISRYCPIPPSLISDEAIVGRHRIGGRDPCGWDGVVTLSTKEREETIARAISADATTSRHVLSAAARKVGGAASITASRKAIGRSSCDASR